MKNDVQEPATRKQELLKKTLRVPLDLVCSAGVAHEAQAMRDGYIKYGYASFLGDGVVISARYCLAAAKRHIERLQAGEDLAPDSKAHHAGHARAMLGIYLECMEAGKLIDDRHPAGKSVPNYIGQMFDRMAEENTTALKESENKS